MIAERKGNFVAYAEGFAQPVVLFANVSVIDFEDLARGLENFIGSCTPHNYNFRYREVSAEEAERIEESSELIWL